MHARLLMVTAAFLVLPHATRGDDMLPSGGGLSITVMGRSTGQPDTMRITLSSSATAGTASDAFQQCEKKSDSAVQAIHE